MSLHPEHILSGPDDFIRFIVAGNATITVVSKRTGSRYTYKIKKAKDSSGRFFVSTLTGPNNEVDYQYLGFFDVDLLDGNPIVRRGQVLIAGRAGNAEDIRFKGFDWLLTHTVEKGAVPDQATVYHEGRCGRCGRMLTTPESIASGIGPECAKKG